jgi:membrane-associated PAP2 superfamily phosphatase
MKPTQPFPALETISVSALFLATIAALGFWQLDMAIASRWAFDATTGQFRAHGSFWANELLHKGGRDFVIALAVAALCCALLGRVLPGRYPQLHKQARTIIGAVLGMGLTVLLVGVFKRYSHMDCPWDLLAYGGKDPYVSLFATRPTGLPPGGCFPAAHAATGYALFSFYFAFRQTHPRFARLALAGALLLGVTFGVAQQLRGAHFLSHDVWSAYLAWTTGLLSQRAWHSWIAARAANAHLPSATFMSSELPVQLEIRSSPD